MVSDACVLRDTRKGGHEALLRDNEELVLATHAKKQYCLDDFACMGFETLDFPVAFRSPCYR